MAHGLALNLIRCAGRDLLSPLAREGARTADEGALPPLPFLFNKQQDPLIRRLRRHLLPQGEKEGRGASVVSSFVLGCVITFASCAVHADEADVVKSVTISAPRDLGFFQGDLLEAKVDVVVADGYAVETASLPRPGPVNYWLDLRKVEVGSRGVGDGRRYTFRILYQDFYDALDARQQEIPSFPISFSKDGRTATASVPAWTIGVSPLREISPPPKAEPKDYMRGDTPAPTVAADPYWQAAGAALLASLAALLLLARDRAWWPFQARPARVFGSALRRLRALGRRPVDEGGYLEGLRVVHRGIDATAGRRVLAEDLPAFLERHPIFTPMRERLSAFFAASRRAFFRSDPRRARAELDFPELLGLARRLAAIERAEP